MQSSSPLLRGEGKTGSASFHQQKSFIFTDLRTVTSPVSALSRRPYATITTPQDGSNSYRTNERTNGIPYSVRRLLKPMLEHKLPPLFGRATFWEICLPGCFHHSLHNGTKNPMPPCDTPWSHRHDPQCSEMPAGGLGAGSVDWKNEMEKLVRKSTL